VCAGALVAVAGVVGLIRGAAAQPVPSASSAGIVVTHAYVPVPLSVVPDGAHSRLVLATDHGLVMIERVHREIQPGRTAHLELGFRHAGVIHVAAPVIAVGAPVPGGH
jgi:hypothetical protein